MQEFATFLVAITCNFLGPPPVSFFSRRVRRGMLISIKNSGYDRTDVLPDSWVI